MPLPALYSGYTDVSKNVADTFSAQALQRAYAQRGAESEMDRLRMMRELQQKQGGDQYLADALNAQPPQVNPAFAYPPEGAVNQLSMAPPDGSEPLIPSPTIQTPQITPDNAGTAFEFQKYLAAQKAAALAKLDTHAEKMLARADRVKNADVLYQGVGEMYNKAGQLSGNQDMLDRADVYKFLAKSNIVKNDKEFKLTNAELAFEGMVQKLMTEDPVKYPTEISAYVDAHKAVIDTENAAKEKKDPTTAVYASTLDSKAYLYTMTDDPRIKKSIESLPVGDKGQIEVTWDDKKEKIAKINFKKDPTTTIAVGGMGSVPDAGYGGWSPEEKEWWFKNRRDTGEKPSFGMGSAAAKSRAAFEKEYATWSVGEGKSGAEQKTASEGFKSDSSSLKKSQYLADTTRTFVGSMDGQIKRINILAKENPTTSTGLRILNLPINEAKRVIFGSPNLSKYRMYITQIENEAGKISTGSQASIRELNEGTQKKWEKIHDKNLNLGDMLSLLKETRTDAQIKADEMTKTVEMIRTRMKGTGGAGSAATPNKPTKEAYRAYWGPKYPKKTRAEFDAAYDKTYGGQ